MAPRLFEPDWGAKSSAAATPANPPATKTNSAECFDKSIFRFMDGSFVRLDVEGTLPNSAAARLLKTAQWGRLTNERF